MTISNHMWTLFSELRDKTQVIDKKTFILYKSVNKMSFENDNAMTSNHRIVEVIDELVEHQTFTNSSSINTKVDHGPILGYVHVSLLPLVKACAPFVNIVYNVLFYAPKSYIENVRSKRS